MAQLTNLVASLGGVKDMKTTDWYTGLARDRNEDDGLRSWSLNVQRDVELALTLGLLSQEAYDALQ